MLDIRGRRRGAACFLLPLIGFLLLLTGLSPATGHAVPLLSEVFYDAVGPDNGLSFVELWGEPGTRLDGMTLEGVNGSNGAITPSVSLSGRIGGDGLFLIADDAGDGSTSVPDPDLIVNFDFQNGPDSIVLRDAAGSAVDALGYGVFGETDVFAGEGEAALDVEADLALARVFADVDTDDNLADFAAAAPTPGRAPRAVVPEPASLLLLSAGLLGLGQVGHARSRLVFERRARRGAGGRGGVR